MVTLHDADANDNIHDCVAMHDAYTNDNVTELQKDRDLGGKPSSSGSQLMVSVFEDQRYEGRRTPSTEDRRWRWMKQYLDIPFVATENPHRFPLPRVRCCSGKRHGSNDKAASLKVSGYVCFVRSTRRGDVGRVSFTHTSFCDST